MYTRKILMGCLLAPLLLGIILTVASVSEPKETISVVKESVCFGYLPGK